MEYHHGYWQDQDRKAAFQKFMIAIHGLDFKKWDELGFWDSNYHPFSFFENGEVVSNVCIYSLDMIVDGTRQKVAQISGVGTRLESRRQGLNRQLTRRATEWALSNGHAFFFLFANDDAVSYYQKLGYLPLQEKLPVLDVTFEQNRAPALEKLDVSNGEHLKLIYRLAQNRASVSNVLGCLSAKLTMFHVLYTLSDNLYYAWELDVVLCFSVEGTTLRFFDVIGENIPSFEQVSLLVDCPKVKKVEFMFHPDKLGVVGLRFEGLDENNLHVSEGLSLSSSTLVPFVAHA